MRKKKQLLQLVDNRYLRQKISRKFNLKIIKAYDFDGTLFEPIGTFEKDFNLDKFKKDNSFIRNLFTKELPLAKELRKAKKRGDIIFIITAREYKWWFPLLLFLRNIPYDEIRQRPKERKIDTAKLKKEQLIDLISKYGNSYYLDFYDDSKINCDEIEQGVKFATVHKIN